jgi:hypothetical protein
LTVSIETVKHASFNILYLEQWGKEWLEIYAVYLCTTRAQAIIITAMVGFRAQSRARWACFSN